MILPYTNKSRPSPRALEYTRSWISSTRLGVSSKRVARNLSEEEKAYNAALSRVRVKIENVWAQLKTFKILAERYRNKRQRYYLKFSIIAGLVNLQNGFS